MIEPLKAVLIGAGQRGNVYTSYALRQPKELEIVGVADPNDDRRESFRSKYNIPEPHSFKKWEDLLSGPRIADAVIICTQDSMHYEPTMAALELGYHVLLEKPMSPSPQECVAMAEQADRKGRILTICHVLRYSPFFVTLKQLLERGEIGDLVTVQHNENVGYWHQAHSFVRGNWRRADESSPMILAKSCHDMDILQWLIDDVCTEVSSFGSLFHFKVDQAPAGAPMRCLDGCPVSDTCAYYAPRIYLTENTDWPTSVISEDLSFEGRYQALQEGPYGRCVYHCDNDVVDHQVVNMRFKKGTTVAFTMTAFTNDVSRTMKLMGTKGEIRASMEKNEIEYIRFGTNQRHLIRLEEADGHVGHGGGDSRLVADFVRQAASGVIGQGRTSARASVQSHLLAFAAETSRLENRIVHMDHYMK